jgi:hypothetical protein
MKDEGDLGASVGAWIAGLQLGPAVKIGGVELVPLLMPHANGVVDRLAHQALADGGLEVVEKGDGVVQELLALSHSPVPILILEGETLLGAKQNRMVAHTVVVGPGTKVVIPVGCMEHGRWRARSERFEAGLGVSAMRMRRDAKTDVMAARQRGSAPSLDQSRLWDQVSREIVGERLTSQTSDFNVVMEKRDRENAHVRNLRPRPGQVGLLALRQGDLVAMELVGHPETWAPLFGRVLASLVPDAADMPRGRRRRGSGEWMGAIRDAALRLRERPAVGIGADVELETRHLIGSGVWMGDRMAHLSVYAPA